MKYSKIDLRPIETLFKNLTKPLTKKKRVLIVRHGQSEGNVKPIFYGSKDYALTDVGKAQARLLSPIFKKYHHLFDGFATSNLTRAMETYKECLNSVENQNFLANLHIRNNPNYEKYNGLEEIVYKDGQFKIKKNLDTVDFLNLPKENLLENILNNSFTDNIILESLENAQNQNIKSIKFTKLIHKIYSET